MKYYGVSGNIKGVTSYGVSIYYPQMREYCSQTTHIFIGLNVGRKT